MRGGDVWCRLYDVDVNVQAARHVRPAGGGGGGGEELLVRRDAVDGHYQGVSHRAGEVNLRVRERSFERDRSVVVILHGNVEHGARQTLHCVGGGQRGNLTMTTSPTEILKSIINVQNCPPDLTCVDMSKIQVLVVQLEKRSYQIRQNKIYHRRQAWHKLHYEESGGECIQSP